MEERLIENSLIPGTVVLSRTFQEGFRIQEGESHYAILANLIEINQYSINQFAEFCSSMAGQAFIEYRRKEIYEDKKKGKAANWLNRNIYQSPNESNIKERRLTVETALIEATMEWLAKAAVNGVYDYTTKKSNEKAIQQVYLFLNNYALTDQTSTNKERADIELAKIRSFLPLGKKQQAKLYETAKSKELVELCDLPSMLGANNNQELNETLTYYLFDLYVNKYGDEKGELTDHLEQGDYAYNGMSTLLEYYNFLGFTGKTARDLIRENAQRYDIISRDQAYYAALSRSIVREKCLNLAAVDTNRIMEHCNMMAKNDPYQLRRRSVQQASMGAIKAAAGILTKRPDLAISGGALALSQFQLEDGDVATILQREFQEAGVDSGIFNLMLDQANNISKQNIIEMY